MFIDNFQDGSQLLEFIGNKSGKAVFTPYNEAVLRSHKYLQVVTKFYFFKQHID